MPFESLRILHADHPRLDEQIPNVDQISGDALELIQDATLESMKRLAHEAVSQNVDVVVLTGQLFAADGPTLRGLVTLKKSLEQLVEHGIQVVLATYGSQSVNYRDQDWFPEEGVHRLFLRGAHSVVLERDGLGLCEIKPISIDSHGGARVDPPQFAGGQRAIFERRGETIPVIGIAQGHQLKEWTSSALPEEYPVGLEAYAAMDGDDTPRTGFHESECSLILLADSERTSTHFERIPCFGAGPLQPLEATDARQHGVRLIELHPNQSPQTQFLPLAAVEFHRSDVRVPQEVDLDEILLQAHEHVSSLSVSKHAGLEVVHWVLHVFPSTKELFSRESARNEFIDFMTRQDESDDVLERCHILSVEDADTLQGLDVASRMYQEFIQVMEEAAHTMVDHETQTDWFEPVNDWETTQGISGRHSAHDAAILTHAKRLGREWFVTAQMEEQS